MEEKVLGEKGIRTYVQVHIPYNECDHHSLYLNYINKLNKKNTKYIKFSNSVCPLVLCCI